MEDRIVGGKHRVVRRDMSVKFNNRVWVGKSQPDRDVLRALRNKPVTVWRVNSNNDDEIRVVGYGAVSTHRFAVLKPDQCQ